MINEILRIIKQLLKNVFLLQKIVSRQDTRSLTTALRKIGSLLCLLSNLFAILQIIALLIQVITDILKLSFPIPPCSTTGGAQSGCCTPDVCPSFIKNGLPTASTGTLQYLNKAGLIVLPSTLALFPDAFKDLFAQQSAIRQESWQFWDPTLSGLMAFYNITFAADAGPNYTFYPSGQTYDAGTNPTKAPYVLNMRIFYNPAKYTDSNGSPRTNSSGTTWDGYARYIRINNCIVTQTPPLQATGWDGQKTGSANGVLYLTGGQAFEDDGKTPITITSVQATLNTLLHNPIEIVSSSAPDNPVLYNDVTYTFTINYEVLVGEVLITVGCIPSVALTKNTINNIYGPTLTENDINLLIASLPNIDGTGAGGADNTLVPANPGSPPNPGLITCLNNALSTMRVNINPPTIAAFEVSTTQCLNQVLSDCNNVIDLATDAGFSATKSAFALAPEVQFTTVPIVVTVTLNDANNTNLCDSIPVEVGAKIATKIIPEITFGVISPFTYDGSAFFNATITSAVAGTGILEVMYNNNFFSTVTIVGTTVTVANTQLPYQFINATVTTVSEPRRDAGDVVRDVDGGE